MKKYVVLHGMVTPHFKRGDVVEESKLTNVGRLLDVQAIREALPEEAKQEHVTLATQQRATASFEAQLAAKDEEIAKLRKRNIDLDAKASGLQSELDTALKASAAAEEKLAARDEDPKGGKKK